MGQFRVVFVALTFILKAPQAFSQGNHKWVKDYYGGFMPGPQNNCVCVPSSQCGKEYITTGDTGNLGLDTGFLHFGGLRRSSCKEYEVCCLTTPKASMKCGKNNPQGLATGIFTSPKIGHAEFGEWPWQGAVLKVENKVTIFKCGATLIDSRHVLTVAHCVTNFTKENQFPLRIRLGEWDTQHKDEHYLHQDYDVEKIFIHPSFDAISLWNDIAVLRLKQDVIFKPHISPVCLPNLHEIFEGQNCVVSGWGKDAFKGGSYTNLLREIHVPVIRNDYCEVILQNTRLGHLYHLYEGFICAGGEEDEDSCKGDGGGPLMCQRGDGSYGLAGLVGWGVECGKPGLPGIYIRVQMYLSWITSITGRPIESYWPY
ncbi:phenoloxidase-activating factor 2-like isoform X2 [Tachypleus tridentatus]